MGEYDKAIADYTETIRLNSKRDYDMAILNAPQVIRLQSRSAEAYYYRGTSYLEKGDRHKAESDFDQAKKLGFKPQ